MWRRDARGAARHFVAGDRGCDLFTFAGDKIARKSSYFKTRTA
jgi:hypothetical protein